MMAHRQGTQTAKMIKESLTLLDDDSDHLEGQAEKAAEPELAIARKETNICYLSSRLSFSVKRDTASRRLRQSLQEINCPAQPTARLLCRSRDCSDTSRSRAGRSRVRISALLSLASPLSNSHKPASNLTSPFPKCGVPSLQLSKIAETKQQKINGI
jgi:hypothetical protein